MQESRLVANMSFMLDKEYIEKKSMAGQAEITEGGKRTTKSAWNPQKFITKSRGQNDLTKNTWASVQPAGIKPMKYYNYEKSMNETENRRVWGDIMMAKAAF